MVVSMSRAVKRAFWLPTGVKRGGKFIYTQLCMLQPCVLQVQTTGLAFQTLFQYTVLLEWCVCVNKANLTKMAAS